MSYAPPIRDLQAAAERIGELERYLKLLFGREPAGGLVEVRFRRGQGRMRQRFYPAVRRSALAQTLEWLGRSDDVYVGVCPRRRRAGGRAALERAWALWADCDSPTSLEALEGFAPVPTLTVKSGTTEHLHAYWVLKGPLEPGEAERSNRRLAHALGADPRACDAARILRPPGTYNHKHRPAPPVRLMSATGELHEAADVAGGLDDPPEHRPSTRSRTREHSGDPLLAIKPREYVARLVAEPGRDGKLLCPFHSDRTPSLHVYERPEQGWYCFGCGAGGSIYDLAAALRGLSPRGQEFKELRQRMRVELGLDVAAAEEP